MKRVNLPAEALDFLVARPHLPAYPTDRLQKVGPDLAMSSARNYLQRNNLQATDEQLRAALRPHLEAVWADALAPATAALENNPTWCRIPTNPTWDWEAIYSSPTWQEASRGFLTGMAQAGEETAKEVGVTSDADRTDWELRTEHRLKGAQAAGDERKVVELSLLLAEQRQARRQAELLTGTLTDIQKAVLLKSWRVNQQREEARLKGFVWGGLWIGAAYWGFWGSGSEELREFLSHTLGLSPAHAAGVALLTWLGGLVVLFQQGLAGKTFLHLLVGWCRKRVAS